MAMAIHHRDSDRPVEVFSTCPNSSGAEPERYLDKVADVARWSEQHGCRGILVYTDNSLVDPWLVSQIIIENTAALCPLVAVQPAYAHPYAVAKMAASFAFLYGRRIYLNMVAGGFTNDLQALNDATPHDRRYDRLTEYTTIIRRLLSAPAPVTFSGEFYKVDNLRMTPSLPPELFPGIFVSGSSEAGLASARATGATAIRYPKPAGDYDTEPLVDGIPSGVRVGIIARDSDHEAWDVARRRFPEDRRGQLTRQLAAKVSDSSWHKQLSAMADDRRTAETPYWLVPFQNYRTMCPYLVGSYAQVGSELARYITVGYRTFILDIPPDEEELRHINRTFDCASCCSLS